MDQPLVTHENQLTKGFHENITPSGSQEENQDNIIPHNINHQELPYYSSQDNSLPVEKPQIQSQNPINTSTQDYDNTPQNESSAPINIEYSNYQNVTLPVQDNNIQYANQVQYQYENYQNINQIPHKGIYQKDKNTFYISTGFCFKLAPFIFFFLGVGLLVYGFLKDNQGIYIVKIVGGIFTFGGLLLFFTLYNDIYFIMGQDTLTIKKKALCWRKTNIYGPGELDRIEFNYRSGYNSKGSAGGERKEERRTHNYSLTVVDSEGERDNIFSIGNTVKVFTPEEIDYFLYCVSARVRTKMRV